MWSKIKVSEIKKDALLSLNKDYNGRLIKKSTVLIYFKIVPALFSVVLLLSGAKINTDIANYFITGISLFAGLFFNLLLIVADKLNLRKRLLEKDTNEETINYVKRYRHFSEQLISQISYTIIISIGIIVLMFFTYFRVWLPHTDIMIVKYVYKVLKYLLNGMIFYYGIQFILMIFVILSSMYIMLLDDLKLK